MPWFRGARAHYAVSTLMLLFMCVGCREDWGKSAPVGPAVEPKWTESSKLDEVNEGRRARTKATSAARIEAADRSRPEEATPKPPGSDQRSPPDPPSVSSLTDGELRTLAFDNQAALGSLSLGRPHQGALLNPMQLTDGPNWIVAYPDNAWATTETLGYLKHVFGVAELQAGPAAYIGDLSARWGGPLSPHQSHQSGRDVDIGYYRLDDRWWADASAATLDTDRTWALLRALITTTDVEVIFVDRSLQPLLRTFALRTGTSPSWLDRLFEGEPTGRPSLIRHAPEHLNHFHVRFYNPEAQRIGRVVHDLVVRGVQRAPAVVVPNRCLPSSCR